VTPGEGREPARSAAAPPPPTRVIGLGQWARGCDEVGLELARRLAAADLPPAVEVLAERDPARLVDHLEGPARVLLVDAVVRAAPPGTVELFRPEELAGAEVLPVSSHGVGVAQAVALARALRGPRIAPEVAVLTVAIPAPGPIGEGWTPEVEAALPEALEAVRAWLGGASPVTLPPG